jgi:hypothetical protein
MEKKKKEIKKKGINPFQDSFILLSFNMLLYEFWIDMPIN